MQSNQKVLTKAEEQVMQTLWRLQRGGLREITDAMCCNNFGTHRRQVFDYSTLRGNRH